MSHLLLYGTAISRLHADLLVVRLRQMGVYTSSISLLHSPSMRPNSAVCWLQGSSTLESSSGEKISISATSGGLLSDAKRNSGSLALVRQLCRLGLTVFQSVDLEETILEKRIIILVEIQDKADLQAILHTFHELGVEKIHTVSASNRTYLAAQRSPSQALSSAGLAFSGVAA